MSLIAELHRRNVIRVGTAYVAFAWLVVQVLDSLAPGFGLSDAVTRLVVIVLAIGLVPVLVASWLFELTPEDLARNNKVDHDAPARRNAARRLDQVIIAMLAVAVSYFAFDKFVLDPGRDAEIAIEADRVDPESYALFLQARHLLQRQRDEGAAEAETLLDEALARDPNNVAALLLYARIYGQNLYWGHLTREQWASRLREKMDRVLAIDRIEAHEAALSELEASVEDEKFERYLVRPEDFLASAYAWVGRHAEAFDILEQRIDPPASNGPQNWNTDPLFQSLHDDPRWNGLLERAGLAPHQLRKFDIEKLFPGPGTVPVG
jgi:tetratricopeptide (TPR) repeat protein